MYADHLIFSLQRKRQSVGERNQSPRTEHGHVLLAAEVPVAPVGPVAVRRGVLLVVVRRLRAEGVNYSDVAPKQTRIRLSQKNEITVVFQMKLIAQREEICVHCTPNWLWQKVKYSNW